LDSNASRASLDSADVLSSTGTCPLGGIMRYVAWIGLNSCFMEPGIMLIIVSSMLEQSELDPSSKVPEESNNAFSLYRILC
jgi:hypothetical protein